MLQQDQPDDYVLATGTTTSVRDFVKMAFGHAGIAIEFFGKGKSEKGIVSDVSGDAPVSKGDVVVEVDSRYFRPTEVDILQGDASKAKRKLGWSPKYSLHELAKEMVEADIEQFRKDVILRDSGYQTVSHFE